MSTASAATMIAATAYTSRRGPGAKRRRTSSGVVGPYSGETSPAGGSAVVGMPPRLAAVMMMMAAVMPPARGALGGPPRALARRRAAAPERPQRRQRVAPGQVEVLAVGDDGVIGALGATEGHAAGLRLQPDRAPVAQLGEVDDAPDHGCRARDPAAGVVGPAHAPAPGGQGVE